ncbi:MAG: hypothetical protein JJ974_01590 [Phycisphaerales bacterium]|nr:hypothetical protein [Phycisphaerales bacterium]
MSEPPLVHIPKQKTVLPAAETASIRDVMGSFQVLRSSVLELFGAAGVDPTKTRELARDLGLNRGLAWKLSRVARSIDGTDVAHDVPGKQSMERFITVCEQRGAHASLISKAREATDAFERSVASCSGGRKTLAMLLANSGENVASQDRERSRRMLFDGACSVWGVQAQTRFVSVYLCPSRTAPGMLDAAHVTGYIGFRQFGSRPWPMSYEAVHDKDGKTLPINKDPLDDVGYEEGDLQLLREFCEPADPKIEVQMQGDYKVFNLAAGPVGNRGLTTCVFGSFLRSIYSTTTNEDHESAGFMVMLQTPVERVIFDYFIHDSVRHSGEVVTHMLDRLTYPHDNRVENFDAQSMAIAEQGYDLPRGIDGAATAHLPWYPRLMQFIETRTGYGINEFHGSRFEMTYPPISTTLSRRIEIQ